MCGRLTTCQDRAILKGQDGGGAQVSDLKLSRGLGGEQGLRKSASRDFVPGSGPSHNPDGEGRGSFPLAYQLIICKMGAVIAWS